MNKTSDGTDRPDDTPHEKPRPGESRVSTDELFNGTRELIIEHTGEEYRLRITSKGKLILTK